jgi:hypothetical protein
MMGLPNELDAAGDKTRARSTDLTDATAATMLMRTTGQPGQDDDGDLPPPVLR